MSKKRKGFSVRVFLLYFVFKFTLKEAFSSFERWSTGLNQRKVTRVFLTKRNGFMNCITEVHKLWGSFSPLLK
jgi:hypothetical protein